MPNFSVQSFRSDRAGAVAITVAIFASVLAISAGVAVDMARAYQTRLVLQESVDQAAMAAASVIPPGARPAPPDEARMVEVVQAYLASEARLGGGQVEMGAPQVGFLAPPQNAVTVSVTAQIATTFLRFAEISRISLAVSSRARRPEPPDVELVLVMDMTQAMAEIVEGKPKGGAVAASAMSLAQRVMALKGGKVGIVPYGSWVNVGTTGEGLQSLQSQPWLDLSGAGSKGCAGGNGLGCDNADLAQNFNGCVGTRRSLQDSIESPTNPKYPGLVSAIDGACSTPRITDLTGATDPAAAGTIREAISIASRGSQSSGSFMPGGLVWGWNMLDPDIPLTRASRPADGAHKVIVLVSGGPNTLKPVGAGFLPQSPAAEANQLTASLCGNIKKAGITIYTVSFGIDDADTSAMLSACASNPQQHFEVSSNAELSEAMNRIGNSLGEIRLISGMIN